MHFNAILTLKSDSNHLSANFNHSNQTRSIQMQILTISKGFEAFERKFEPFE